MNTRCIYHRITRSRSDPNNMTLCPILDFANHTANPPYTLPQTSPADIWDDIAPPMKHKFGHDFTLLSPSVSVTSLDSQLFLKYGSHPNSTLFAEYGFAEPNSEGEVLLDFAIDPLFTLRGHVGLWMKDILIAERYWGWAIFLTVLCRNLMRSFGLTEIGHFIPHLQLLTRHTVSSLHCGFIISFQATSTRYL